MVVFAPLFFLPSLCALNTCRLLLCRFLTRSIFVVRLCIDELLQDGLLPAFDGFQTGANQTKIIGKIHSYPWLVVPEDREVTIEPSEVVGRNIHSNMAPGRIVISPSKSCE